MTADGTTAANSFLVSTVTPFFLGVSYVASLYVWPVKYDRDHPDTIKKRFISAAFMTVLSPLLVYKFGASYLLENFTLWEVLGIRWEGLVTACILPLFLTFVLFLGPSVMLLMDDGFRVFCIPMFWKHNLQDWIWWRNHIVAPFSEEFTYRACMLPILLGYYTQKQAVLISPLFFGIAHLHHMLDRIRKGQDIISSILISLFQFSYTTIFGMYSAFLFVNTGHFAAPFIIHAYCNFMGFPDLVEVWNCEPRKRTFLMVMFVLGVVFFYLLFTPLTNPHLYENRVYANPAAA